MSLKESWWQTNFGLMVLLCFIVIFASTALEIYFLQSQLSECQVDCSSEKYAKELEKDLLFYHDTNRGLHFLDEDGCEWRIVIEPATAYVDCKQPQQPYTEVAK